MTWVFDQGRNVVCITNRAVLDGAPITSVSHYDDDHSWSFWDDQPFDTALAMVVGMGTVVDRHPDIVDIAELPPGWRAFRAGPSEAWEKHQV